MIFAGKLYKTIQKMYVGTYHGRDLFLAVGELFITLEEYDDHQNNMGSVEIFTASGMYSVYGIDVNSRCVLVS